MHTYFLRVSPKRHIFARFIKLLRAYIKVFWRTFNAYDFELFKCTQIRTFMPWNTVAKTGRTPRASVYLSKRFGSKPDFLGLLRFEPKPLHDAVEKTCLKKTLGPTCIVKNYGLQNRSANRQMAVSGCVCKRRRTLSLGNSAVDRFGNDFFCFHPVIGSVSVAETRIVDVGCVGRSKLVWIG